MPDPTHLDDVAGALARVLQVLRPPAARNTLDRLGVYEGRSLETLFPAAPQSTPVVTRRARWSLPGLISEDLSFTSLHEPLEPAFRRYYHARRRRIHTVYARRLPGPTRARVARGCSTSTATCSRRPSSRSSACSPRWRRPCKWRWCSSSRPTTDGASRAPPASTGESYWTADVVQSIESLRQTLLDARTLLAVLQDESPQPVGVAGLSLGGALAEVLTCLEPGFAFSAPFIAHMDLGALVADAPVLGAMREDLLRFGWTPRDFGAFTKRLGWDELRPLIPPERICLFAARDDHFFRAPVVRAMWRRWQKPRIHWYPASHMGFLVHLPDAVGRLRNFS